MRWLTAEASARVPISARKADELVSIPVPSSAFIHDNSDARNSCVHEPRESAAF